MPAQRRKTGIQPAAGVVMDKAHPPMRFELESRKQEAIYDEWLRARVDEALRSTQSPRSHNAALAWIETELASRRKTRAAS
jgi:hypothetical protein